MYIIWECSTKHEIPDQPWVKIGTDLFSLDNKDYVIVVDYTSFLRFHVSQILSHPL